MSSPEYPSSPDRRLVFGANPELARVRELLAAEVRLR